MIGGSRAGNDKGPALAGPLLHQLRTRPLGRAGGTLPAAGLGGGALRGAARDGVEARGGAVRVVGAAREVVAGGVDGATRRVGAGLVVLTGSERVVPVDARLRPALLEVAGLETREVVALA